MRIAALTAEIEQLMQSSANHEMQVLRLRGDIASIQVSGCFVGALV